MIEMKGYLQLLSTHTSPLPPKGPKGIQNLQQWPLLVFLTPAQQLVTIAQSATKR